jgi:hypothetical protein
MYIIVFGNKKGFYFRRTYEGWFQTGVAIKNK